MLETPSSDLPAASATVKRYAPPNQRNRSLGRRKSGGGDRLDRANSYVNDGGAAKTGPLADAGGYSRANEARVKLIPLQGCTDSEATQLLRNRWAAAMNAHNSLPEDSADRPVVYTKKSTSAWRQPILPHLLIQPTGGGGIQRDFMSELREAINSANSGHNP